jgi:hypothetical protein
VVVRMRGPGVDVGCTPATGAQPRPAREQKSQQNMLDSRVRLDVASWGLGRPCGRVAAGENFLKLPDAEFDAQCRQVVNPSPGYPMRQVRPGGGQVPPDKGPSLAPWSTLLVGVSPPTFPASAALNGLGAAARQITPLLQHGRRIGCCQHHSCLRK